MRLVLFAVALVVIVVFECLFVPSIRCEDEVPAEGSSLANSTQDAAKSSPETGAPVPTDGGSRADFSSDEDDYRPKRRRPKRPTKKDSKKRRRVNINSDDMKLVRHDFNWPEIKEFVKMIAMWVDSKVDIENGDESGYGRHSSERRRAQDYDSYE